MDSSDFPVIRSPRKELQGQRPPALKVHKDSYKIKKPPVAPQQPSQLNQQQQQTQARPPVIIYTVSPKVIHTNPSDFMSLVQRLTGSSASTTSTHLSASTSNPFNDDSGAISAAARYATMEKGKTPKEQQKQQPRSSVDVGFVEGMLEIDQVMERPGILSPGPALLPPIPQNFFSPSDPNSTGCFFHDNLSPVLHGNRNFIEGSTFMPSPSNFVSPRITSPTTPSIDLFNNFTSYNNYFDF